MAKTLTTQDAGAYVERIVSGIIEGRFELRDLPSGDVEVVSGDTVRYVWTDRDELLVRYGFAGVSYYGELGRLSIADADRIANARLDAGGESAPMLRSQFPV